MFHIEAVRVERRADLACSVINRRCSGPCGKAAEPRAPTRGPT
jgi:hypothetical protein